jgi:hypothetical protein
VPDWEVSAWPRADHLQRVFHVRSGQNLGTAFSLDIDGRQYLVSALHVVEESTKTASLEIHRGNAWTPYVVNTVGSNSDADVVVFALQERLVNVDLDEIDISSDGCALGQEVFS